MEAARYVVGVLLVVSIPPALVWWFLVHPFVGFWRAMGARKAMTVVATTMIAAAVGLVFVRDRLLGADLGTSWPLVALAALLLTGAVILGIRRKRHLDTRTLSGMPELEGDDSRLLTQGPYSVIRHPRYVEVVLGVFAYAAFSNHVGAWITAVATVPVLHVIVLMEERELLARFGNDYRDYRARVPRYLPRLLSVRAED